MAKPTKLTKAIAYLRTSSAANVGSDKDSDKRQRAAIEAFAKRAGLEITEEFYDQDVSGADPIESRPGFSAVLDRIESNGVRTVVVEDVSRFARQLIVQEAGIIALIERGVRVHTSSGDANSRTATRWSPAAMRSSSSVRRSIGETSCAALVRGLAASWSTRSPLA
jgi:DNA invertase Pin-like site-specific DNA recombinase